MHNYHPYFAESGGYPDLISFAIAVICPKFPAVTLVMSTRAATLFRPVFCLFIFLALAVPAARAQTVLVWSMGNNLAGTQSVAAWLNASGKFTSVTAYEGTALTLADLSSYQAILFFSNGTGDPNVGNTLADFADTGRGLVIATFAYANQSGNTLGGRIITDSISPVVLNGSSLYTSATIGTTDGSAFFTGVASITGDYRDSVSPVTGAVVRATWSDGRPLLVTKANVVAITLFPDDTAGFVSGDYRNLFINSLTFAAIPEPSTYALLVLGAVLLGFVHRRRRAPRAKSIIVPNHPSVFSDGRGIRLAGAAVPAAAGISSTAPTDFGSFPISAD